MFGPYQIQFVALIGGIPRNLIRPYIEIFLFNSLTYVSVIIFSLSFKKKFSWAAIRDLMFMDAFLIFPIWVSRNALMLSDAGTLSAFSRTVLVESKFVFKSLGASVSDSSNWFVQGYAVGKINSFF